ncbi:bifunctional endoribonuclease/protein kinase ire1 [Coemansia sp. RSA 1646]|nr:bifunctional endoribonuclease/protein kinase ire1 [Coemansia sp. RSA 1646]KAJ2087695.1 bifunctional endoribonuclease/protein kinase ire1 [Coemansia sp. RSA 986]KAJ2212598.1 bifunctional endoribonuclease/protein kinase ire1 [Coemansia sp. RSA 487]
MEWLNTAIWNLCISLLPHRNTRALLVPLLCVALLAPLAASTAATAMGANTPVPSIATATPAFDGLAAGDALGGGLVVSMTLAPTTSIDHPSEVIVDSMLELSQQAQSRGGGQVPTASQSFLEAPTYTECHHNSDDADSFCMAYGGLEYPFIDARALKKPAGAGSAHSVLGSGAAEHNGRFEPRHDTNVRRQKISKRLPRQKQKERAQNQGVVILNKESNGIVPRKFTIPEPSVVADAADNPIEMLPAKPYTAATSESMLLKRSMLERSGVSLVDTMVVVTVDGSMYGVSRYDGSIVWSRPSLLDLAAEHNSKHSFPVGMVWTKQRVDRSLVDVPLSERTCQKTDNTNSARVSIDPSIDLGDGVAIGDYDDYNNSDDDGEEEWLLEQGIDWRSDPQVLENQRQRRREWLAQHRNNGVGRPTESYSKAVVDEVPEAIYIAEPGNDGALYIYSTEFGHKKLPLTIKDLTDLSPVQMRGVLYTGNKEARFSAIDLNTGRLLKSYGDEHEHSSSSSRSSSNSAYHTNKRFSGKRKPIRLLLGEKLNRVRIFPDTDSNAAGVRGSDVPQWELYHRSIHAPTLDPEIDDILTELSDAIEALGSASAHNDNDSGDSTIISASRGPTKFVMTHDGGFVMVEAATGIPLWAQEFDSPVVSVFDVFGISTPDPDYGGSDEKDSNAHVEYVARKRDLSPAAQQLRYRRWRQLHALDDQVRFYEQFSSGRSQSQGGKWRTGSAGGNILAGSFWERSGKTASSIPQIAYIGKLQDTLYTMTFDEFPLIDHASLTSSLLLALAQAKRNQQRYPELQHADWWDRWNFLTHDATVLRVLQEARIWWVGTAASESGLVPENSFEKLLDMIRLHQEANNDQAPDTGATDRLMCDAKNDDRCHYGALIGIHPVEPLTAHGLPALEGAPLHKLGLPSSNEGVPVDDHMNAGAIGREHAENDNDYDNHNTRLDHGRNLRLPWDDEELHPSSADGSSTTAQSREDIEDWPWWRYVGHYATRLAALIGYVVTIAVLLVFAGAMYLLRPRNKRRPRMWVDAAGDDTNAPGRRARLRTSWALMYRMWATLKEEWQMALEEAWRNPNAAAVLRRTGVPHRSGLRKEDEDRDSSSEEGSASSSSVLGRSSSSSSLMLHQQNGDAFGPDINNGGGGAESNRSSRQHSLSRRGSASVSPASLGIFGRDDSEPSSLERLSSGMITPRRNSTGTLSMTPIKRASAEGDSIERMQQASLFRSNQGTQQQQQQVRLGAISMSDQVLGYGSHGTVVYRGEFQGRAVAVKRLLLDFYDVADHEVQVLQESDTHPNVIRYFCTERHDHFMYIALELCCGSLADAIMRSPKARLANQLLSAIPKKTALYQLARGLHHLHALKLVHRDIKPQNILIAPPPHRRRRRRAPSMQPNGDGDADSELTFEDSNIVAGGVPRVLISDFGLSRILDDDESSFANTFTMHGMAAFGGGGSNGPMPGGMPAGMIGGIGGGTVGWRAPECFDSPDTRAAPGSVVGASVSTEHNDEPPSWPSLRGEPSRVVDEPPSPYVSRGTRSRLRNLAMAQIGQNPGMSAASGQEEPQQQRQQQRQQIVDCDDPDSIGTSITSTTDRAGSSIPFANSSGARRRMTRAVDIFSMGCVFYYVLMDGDHPFGDRLSREQRILAGTPDLRTLETSSNSIPSAVEAVDLIAHMVARQERDRPSAASVLVHPYFWDATQRLNFLQDVSDCLEAEARLIKAAREDVPEPPPAKKTKGAKKKGGGGQSTGSGAGGNAGGGVEKEVAAGGGGSSSHVMSKESIEDIIAKLPSQQAAAVRRAITLLDTFEENSGFVMEGAPPSADGFQVVGMPPPPSSHAAAVDAMAAAVGSAGSSSDRDKDQRPRRIAWDRRLDPHLRRDLSKFRKYDSTRLRDLLRTIRNKKNHYQDMPITLRDTLGDIPDGYLHYFESRFPYLLLHCYYFVLEDDSLRTATVFKPYFRPPAL